jgi:TrmH family RNA methyltransferase
MRVELGNIRVVMVESTHPGNIGAAARAMKNMGLQELVLVNPAGFPSGEAEARAVGAVDVLNRARKVQSLLEAITDCTLVIGASARQRTIPWPLINPRECARLLCEASSRGKVALVLGREAHGLSNEELEQCHYLVHIPANPDYSSLNVAMALQILVYEVHMQSLAEAHTQHHAYVLEEEPPATAAELEGLYQHLEKALERIGFLDPENPRQLMRRLRRLFNRSRLDKIEINILRGMLKAAEQAAQAKHSNH